MKKGYGTETPDNDKAADTGTGGSQVDQTGKDGSMPNNNGEKSGSGMEHKQAEHGSR